MIDYPKFITHSRTRQMPGPIIKTVFPNGSTEFRCLKNPWSMRSYPRTEIPAEFLKMNWSRYSPENFPT